MNDHFKGGPWHPYTGLSGFGAPHVERVPTEPLQNPRWLAWNRPLARTLGLPGEPGSEWLMRLSGQAEGLPWCTAYAGHQFGVWAGRLGDGRAHLLGQRQDDKGVWQEIQLKGAGHTPFSRMGDGRAVLRSSIREYLCSEAMAGLGIPTTRALALVGSDQPVMRETLETAAIVTRVAPSFIRFGHFEYFAQRRDTESLKQLTDLVIQRFYPEAAHHPVPALELLSRVVERTAHLVADWQAVGFCHGVMNTDNQSILGLTLDYGPFGFMDRFDAHHVCNHSDTEGRYAYSRQPAVSEWNCGVLANALWPLIKDEQAIRDVLQGFRPAFESQHTRLFRRKFGWVRERDDDDDLIFRGLLLLHEQGMDFTRFFRALSGFSLEGSSDPAWIGDPFPREDIWNEWVRDYRARLHWEQSGDATRHSLMRQANPAFVLRNYLAEEAIRAATEGDTSVLQRLEKILASPFEDHPDEADWAAAPPRWATSLSVSCSS